MPSYKDKDLVYTLVTMQLGEHVGAREVINLKGLMSIGESTQAALDQSHKSANTNFSARRRLAVTFEERGEEDSANTRPAKFKRYRD